MEIKELTNEEFNKFVTEYDLSSIYQTTEYGLVMNNQDNESIFIGLFDENNAVVAASLILIERLGQFKYAYAPRGFLIDYYNKELLSEFTMLIRKYLKKKNIMAIKISPLIIKRKYTPSLNITVNNPEYDKIFENLKSLKFYHLGYNNFFESLKPRYEAIANLDKDIEKMFSNLDDNFKTNINACELAGLRVYKGNESNLNYIYEELREQRKKSKEYVADLYKYFNDTDKIEIYYVKLETEVFLINTQKEYQKQINICNQLTDEVFKNKGKADSEIINKKIIGDNNLSAIKNQLVYATSLLREFPNGIVIASAMVIKHKDHVHLTLDGYNENFKNLCPKYILIWKLMEKYATEGFTELNLGGMSNPEFDGKNEFEELNKFKMGFNSSCVEYAGDFELITSLPLYTLYRNGAPFRKIVKTKKTE